MRLMGGKPTTISGVAGERILYEARPNQPYQVLALYWPHAGGHRGVVGILVDDQTEETPRTVIDTSDSSQSWIRVGGCQPGSVSAGWDEVTLHPTGGFVGFPPAFLWLQIAGSGNSRVLDPGARAMVSWPLWRESMLVVLSSARRLAHLCVVCLVLGAGLGCSDPGRQDSELRRALALLPMSFEEEGIWFSNFGQALDVAGVPRPGSWEELGSWPDAEVEKYRKALGGIYGPNLIMVMRQTPEWSDGMGFSQFDVDASVATGEDYTWPFGTSVHLGRFDADLVRDHLGTLGYQTRAGEVLSLDIDAVARSRDPVHRAIYNSRALWVSVTEEVLVVSPDTEPMAQVLATGAGESPSLDESDPFSRVASALSDPLRAAILPRQMVLEPKSARPVDFEPPAEWASLQEWDLFGAGYGRTADVVTNHIVLHYPQPEWAGLDAAELPRRVEHFLEELERDRPVREFCRSWESAVTVYDTGSVLTVTCETPVSDAVGAGVVELVSPRVLGFLAP